MPTSDTFLEFKREFKKIAGLLALVGIAMNLVSIVVHLKLRKGPLALRVLTAAFLFVVLDVIIYLWASIIT